MKNMSFYKILGKSKYLHFYAKSFYYNHFKHISLISGGDCRIKKLHLESCGKHNVVRLGNHVLLDEVTITIFGNNNEIVINDMNYLSNIRFAIEDDANQIEIGKQCYLGPGCLLAALEGTKIKIGDDCMIASSCEIRTSDSHSLLDRNGERINNAQDIILGGHVWIAMGSLILKGANISKDCVVAAKAVVCKMTEQVKEGSLLGGTPARVLKENISWNHKRI